MSANTQYGKCLGCGKWVPRDEMLSINVAIYDASNVPERIRIRSCPKCHPERMAEFRAWNWDHILKSESDIQADPELAAQSDLEFDDSEAAMREAGLIPDSAMGTKS